VNGRAAFGLVCATCAAACSLFVDTGEFTNDDAVDAGSDSAVAPPDADAPPEASVTTDAAVDGADAGPPPCPDGGLCDSFERMTVVGPWSGFTDNAKGCTLAIDGMLGHDGPSSLRMFVPQLVQDDCQAFLHRDFVGSPKSFRMSFSIRVASVLTREVHLFNYEVQAPTRALYFSSYNGTLLLAEQQYGSGGTYESSSIAGLEPGKWNRFVLEHDVATRNTTVTLDGQLRLTRQTGLSYAGADFALFLGNSYSRAGDANDIWFDDVRFEPTF
jgi:hypothetical protein